MKLFVQYDNQNFARKIDLSIYFCGFFFGGGGGSGYLVFVFVLRFHKIIKHFKLLKRPIPTELL